MPYTITIFPQDRDADPIRVTTTFATYRDAYRSLLYHMRGYVVESRYTHAPGFDFQERNFDFYSKSNNQLYGPAAVISPVHPVHDPVN